MKIITTKQALREARRIWGKNAYVRNDGKPHILPNGAKLSGQYAVGKILMGFFSVEGDGDSWDEAFTDYEQKRMREKQRIAALQSAEKEGK